MRSVTPQSRRLLTRFAATQEDVRAAQRLRYRIFVDEMGARIRTSEPGLDIDHYDAWCRHLLVEDMSTGEVVACTRLLSCEDATPAGGFYSCSEFDIADVLKLPGRKLEVGRTCVHADYRNGAVIGSLWAGLAQAITEGYFQYLIGCASVPLSEGSTALHALMHRLNGSHGIPSDLSIRARHPLPPPSGTQLHTAARIPPLLKGYLAMGARVAAAPCVDEDFQVADIFILFDIRQASPRYVRHFVPATLRPSFTRLAGD